MSDTLFAVVFIPLVVYLGWVLPIRKGLRVAKEKNRSSEWMWFGVHPVSGWITYLVLNNLPALLVCPMCQEKVKQHAKICPYCLTPFGVPPTGHGK